MINQKDLMRKLSQVVLIEGFQKSSMSKLATAVGISRASLYLHFKNKDEVVQAVVERHLGFIAEHPVPQQFSPATFLPIWLASLQLMGTTTEQFMTDLRRAYPEHFQAVSEAQQDYFAQLETYITQGQAQKVLMDVYPADFVIFQAQTLIQGILTRVQHRQLAVDQAGRYVEAILHLQLVSLLAANSQARLDVKQVAGLEAAVLRKFRETYALIL
ncbi:TetR/AcrR family transcriptional regulator [Levilactobacillus angrenensis]|uniref:TetR/AcrR family transcriptional regulator n=1 Tax=Levilactobacillus angrenensis TaxID=2486020 RepID=A0ABW1UB88_9LACO|nr:TetR/AcrR family transcriptional regulator [Levilactobacillus angrenensis]